MSQSGFHHVQSVAISSNDGLPACSCICSIPSLIENSVCLAVGGFDGVVRLVDFKSQQTAVSDPSSDIEPSHSNMMETDLAGASSSSKSEKADNQLADIISVGRDNYPILSVASVSRDGLALLAYGGLGRHVELGIRTSHSFPSFQHLLTIAIPAPITCLSIQTLSYNKKDEIAWNIRLFAGCQDKAIHLYSVSIVASRDASSYKASVFHHLKFIGHNSFVRSISFNHSATGEAVSLLSGSDDFNLKIWPLNLLESEKITRCTTYEGHEDDIVAVDCKSSWVITGSKDKTVGFLDLNPAKNARAEKSRETRITRVAVGSVVRSVLLSDDARSAFVGLGDGSIKILSRDAESDAWNISQDHKILNAPIDSMLVLQGVLATCSQDNEKTVGVWQIPSSV